MCQAIAPRISADSMVGMRACGLQLWLVCTPQCHLRAFAVPQHCNSDAALRGAAAALTSSIKLCRGWVALLSAFPPSGPRRSKAVRHCSHGRPHALPCAPMLHARLTRNVLATVPPCIRWVMRKCLSIVAATRHADLVLPCDCLPFGALRRAPHRQGSCCSGSAPLDSIVLS